jgi:long-subunit acyl-CoA synthetase (AMP-forming)
MVYRSKIPDVELPQCGIIQFIFENKNNTPDDKKILIDALDDNKYLTYGQLKDSVLKFAAGLQDICGFKRNDVLAVFAHNQVIYMMMDKTQWIALFIVSVSLFIVL